MRRDGDRSLELLILNEECLVSASHQLALIKSLPFGHTARRSYRFRVVRWAFRTEGNFCCRWKVKQTTSLRGRRSRNKVSVGEPAEGSFARTYPTFVNCPLWGLGEIFSCRAHGWHSVEDLWRFALRSLLPLFLNVCRSIHYFNTLLFLQLSATDVLAQATMKGAAKCDKHCELQNSENQQNFERILCCRVTPDSMPASVSVSSFCTIIWLCVGVR